MSDVVWPLAGAPESEWTERLLETAAHTALGLGAGVTVVLARRAGVVPHARALAEAAGLSVTADIRASSILVRLTPRA